MQQMLSAKVKWLRVRI